MHRYGPGELARQISKPIEGRGLTVKSFSSMLGMAVAIDGGCPHPEFVAKDAGSSHGAFDQHNLADLKHNLAHLTLVN